MSPAGPVARLSAPGARGAFAPCVSPELARAWLADAPRWFGPERAPLSEADAHPHLARIESPLGPVVVKRDPTRPWTSGLARLGGRAPRAARAFELGRALADAGLATPEPLAWIEARAPERATLLLQRAAEGDSPWRFLAGRASGPVLAALGVAIAGLHAHGFRHRDLKAPNLLLADDAGTIRVLFLDLDGAARVGRVSPYGRARDLARLAVSFRSAAARQAGLRADAWPMLVDAYLGAAACGLERRALLAWTERWAQAHIERNLRRRRPIA